MYPIYKRMMLALVWVLWVGSLAAQYRPDESGQSNLEEFAKTESSEKERKSWQSPDPSELPVKPIVIKGDASLRYRYQSTKGEHDADLYGTLNLQVNHIVPDKVSFSLYGAVFWDVDGDQYKNDHATDFFRDIYDSYDTSAQGRLYHAFFTLDNWLFPETVFVLGRQTLYLDNAYDFDGAYGEISLFDRVLKFSAFGGASVYHFKGPRGGDWLVGGGVEWMPFPGTKFNLDGFHIAEDSKGEGLTDYEIIFRMRQKLAKEAFLLGQFVLLNDEAKDVTLTTTWTIPDYEIHVKLRFYALFQELENLTTALDPFSIGYKPFQQYEIYVSKNWGEHFTLFGGYIGRMLRHHKDEGVFNREFHRFHVGLSSENWPYDNIEASLTLHGWHTDDKDVAKSRRYGLDAEIGYLFWEKKLKTSLGIAYDLYKYQIFDDNLQSERLGLTSIYTRVKYQATDVLSFFGELAWEYDEDRDYYDLQLGIHAKF